MSDSVIAIQRGFDYQSRLFWLKVCDLFTKHSKVLSVGYEYDELKSFDDVVVTYSEPILEANGLKKHKDFYQSKFHSHQTKPIFYSSLIDPQYIGATKDSFLQKLQNAYQKEQAASQTYIYNLFTPSSIHPDDDLAKIYRNHDGTFNIERFYEGKTVDSKYGKIRNEWSQHLNISEAELRNLILRLKIINGASSNALLEILNHKLYQSGFKPIENGSISNDYDDFIRKLHAMGKNSFSRNEIQEIAKAERLWVGQSNNDYPDEKTIGIRSFIKFAEELPNLTSDMICLSANFNDRFIKSEELWNNKILPETTTFMQKYEGMGETIYVLLETHISIAFAAGQSIHPKASTKFIPVQKNEFRHPEVWNIEDFQAENNGWQIEEIQNQHPAENELAISIGITHPVATDVKDFVNRVLTSVNTILSFEVEPKPSTNSIKNGSHANFLAEELAQKVIYEVKTKGYKSVHLFGAAPVGFMFYLGKKLRLPSDCRINIYEYDFDSKTLGAYVKSITF